MCMPFTLRSRRDFVEAQEILATYVPRQLRQVFRMSRNLFCTGAFWIRLARNHMGSRVSCRGTAGSDGQIAASEDCENRRERETKRSESKLANRLKRTAICSWSRYPSESMDIGCAMR